MPCKIKLCGLRAAEDVQVAVELGVDAIGFVLSESARFISADEAKRLRALVPADIMVHGVVGPVAPEEVRALYLATGVDCMQVHGPDEAAYWDALADLPIVRGFRMKGRETLMQIEASALPRFLLDAYKPGVAGGTGETFDWSLAREANRFGEVILAGGLTADNIAEAIAAAAPWMVDVSGGIESAKGVKDHARMRDFVEAVHAAG